MHEFELSRDRRARVWLDEAPAAHFAASSTTTFRVMPKAVIKASWSIVAVELRIPHGPVAPYALLGAECLASEGSDLQVVLLISSNGPPYLNSLALMPDDVRVGLPAEYANAVKRGVESVATSGGAPTSTSLRVRWAAHGLVGSSPRIFETVSGLLVQLMTLPLNASKQDIVAVLSYAMC